MKLPTHLPKDLFDAFRAVGLVWPGLRLDLLDGVVAELGADPAAESLSDQVRVMRKAQRVFFEHLRDLADEHGGDGTRASCWTAAPAWSMTSTRGWRRLGRPTGASSRTRTSPM
ncbi:hypothetical protein ACIBHY_10730 [Nonomuraea sp. NPDC050547]|uniref:hypothetical protein n=1 Tax=Nonomuraea sp. NPDC050547 TaxID=3364368 RepID=UPI0037A12ECD